MPSVRQFLRGGVSHVLLYDLDFDLFVQRLIQLCCIWIYLVLFSAQTVISIARSPAANDWWYAASVITSVFGWVLAIPAIVAITPWVKPKWARLWLAIFLAYVICIYMPYRVLFVAMGTSGTRRTWLVWILEILITAVALAVGWAQLYSAMNFFVLSRLLEAFHQVQALIQSRLPTEQLLPLMQSLKLRPTMSQVVELLSHLPQGHTSFSFPDFCQLMARYRVLDRRHRVRQRVRHMQHQTETEPLLLEEGPAPVGAMITGPPTIEEGWVSLSGGAGTINNAGPPNPEEHPSLTNPGVVVDVPTAVTAADVRFEGQQSAAQSSPERSGKRQCNTVNSVQAPAPELVSNNVQLAIPATAPDHPPIAAVAAAGPGKPPE